MFLLNPQSKLPLYEQLVEQLRKQIVLGNAAPGSPLPSVRQLSVELGVNQNTIQKAYREMEQEGLIVSLPRQLCHQRCCQNAGAPARR